LNILDENILESQRQLPRSWRIPIRQIGCELGRRGMEDEEIIPFLLTMRRPTIFTNQLGGPPLNRENPLDLRAADSTFAPCRKH
jgi:hypothetical protein